MSKTNFTAKTETIDTIPDMLNYYYYKEIFNDKEINDIILICEKLDSEINELDYSDISVDMKRRNSVSYLPINDKT